jgi:hypothetical protein
MAARKSCQAGRLRSIAALKGTLASKLATIMAPKNSLGTKGLGRVSKAATANPTVWNGQGLSATPIPSPGGNK